MDNRTLKMKADQYRDLRMRALELYRELEKEGFALFTGPTGVKITHPPHPHEWEFRKTEVIKL